MLARALSLLVRVSVRDSPNPNPNQESRLSAGGAGGKEACKFIPYSIGRRVCPGSKLADAELATVSDVLLRELRWSRAAPLDLSEEYSLTLAPARSQSLVFSRAAAAASPRIL